MSRVIPIIGVLLFLQSCGPTPYYSEELPVHNEVWNEELQLLFNVDIQDTTKTYELQLDIEHDTDYRYQNIYLSIETGFPDDEKKNEKLAIDFADKKGNWLGECSGNSCELKVYLLDKFKFPALGRYTFGFHQHTREKELKGVTGLELSLYEVMTDTK